MRQRGFTLIEILIVVVIGGLMLSMALPAFSRQLAASRSSQVGSVVASDLELAFSYAAKQRLPVRIAYNTSTMTYTVADRSSGTVFITRPLGAGTEWGLTAAAFSSTPVDVFPGGIASGSLTVTLTSGASSHTVSMTRAGLVRVN